MSGNIDLICETMSVVCHHPNSQWLKSTLFDQLFNFIIFGNNSPKFDSVGGVGGLLWVVRVGNRIRIARLQYRRSATSTSLSLTFSSDCEWCRKGHPLHSTQVHCVVAQSNLIHQERFQCSSNIQLTLCCGGKLFSDEMRSTWILWKKDTQEEWYLTKIKRKKQHEHKINRFI